MNKPLVAITMGDPAGVGPETIAGAWLGSKLHGVCRAVVVGNLEVMRRAAALYGNRSTVVEVGSPEEADADESVIPCLPCGSASAAEVEPATIDVRGGRAAYDAIVLAAELARHGRVDAITTAPLNKAALWAAGYQVAGHTELLAELCEADDVAMMLYLAHGDGVKGRAGLGVVHVTLHSALRDVFDQLTVDNISGGIHMADTVMRALIGESSTDEPPRIGVCALNPHAGEQGLFGDEELRIIGPAVERGIAAGFSLEGPVPVDTLMMRAAGGEFDAVVAMYHDQGHIALKLLGMHRAVNVTLGLPIIRTSVAHGTAFDLAWQGRAETSGMVEAVRVAVKLVEQRQMLNWEGSVTAS